VPTEIAIPNPAWVEAAVNAAKHSTCLSQRGAAVFTRHGLVWSTGHNRMPPGFTCTSDAACKATCGRAAIHAEQAALRQAGHTPADSELLHIKIVDGQPIPSGPPSCLNCSVAMLTHGIVAVWLLHTAPVSGPPVWTRYDAADFHSRTLEHHGITVARIT
jgi:deoxycytidylate deaminase